MKLRSLVSAVCVGLFVSACASHPPVRQEAHRRVQEGATLVDVRSPEEFAEGHLPGAVNIPVDDLSARLGELGGPDTSIVVYCRSGARSGRAERLLKEQGFRNVLSLGAMSNWE
ncbi:rhodanese-like domain-containing protein [Myxococcus sp. K15C18031901]|uniref:rhodanese-like domain-containing protein n=1 Tax=Myxococcus dinghuensis TaxID=2906761 RepID=UPI0020A77C17|nr:rhodanese-like domain-containing protein [Myxococcus dinghuensis]MCP3100765.1 rhodanese-like domain-containing protein [Myxococcus dinghuensis]